MTMPRWNPFTVDLKLHHWAIRARNNSKGNFTPMGVTGQAWRLAEPLPVVPRESLSQCHLALSLYLTLLNKGSTADQTVAARIS
jgi:hypothetical protein